VRLGFVIRLVLIGLCAAGCARETLPEDSFRLTAREVFADETERVVVLRLEAAMQQMYTVTVGEARLECQLTNSEADEGVFQSEIWLFASRLPPDANGHEHARIYMRGGDGQPIHTKTNLRASTRFTNMVEIATGTPLEKVLTVEQTNHLGKLDSPVVIARLAGQAARLLVGPAALTIRKP
jgi:hypothetical protein